MPDSLARCSSLFSTQSRVLMEGPRFVATPWRGRGELLALRGALFGGDALAKREGVDRVRAWRARGAEIPLLLESTADLVEGGVLDAEGTLEAGALALVYAAAVARFVTGLADSQTELARARPSWIAPTQTITFPAALRETRHCIVHRHLPSLAELKRAAKESLDWLWEWYWSQLDAAFASATPAHIPEREAREQVQAVLKSYVKARKAEIKRRGKSDTAAAERAVAAVLSANVQAAVRERMVLDYLVGEGAVLPADKKLGSSLGGAFLIWDPFLLALCTTTPRFLRTWLERLVASLSAASSRFGDVEVDPAREGWYEWCLHVLTSREWTDMRSSDPDGFRSGVSAEIRLVEFVLGLCFSGPVFWTLKLAAAVLEEKEWPAREQWLSVLEAARSEDVEMGVETQGEAEKNDPPGSLMAREETQIAVQKTRGPRKKVGLWKPVPIGTVVGGG